MNTKLEIYSAPWPNEPYQCFPDFKIGKLRLATHLNVGSDIGVLSVCADYARQLMLKKPSELESGRVPLYVCSCCADLGCGAITVLVEKTEDTYIWSNFRRESNGVKGFSQSEYMLRTGPFTFEKDRYISVINQYSQ